jgi:hypothetical protein
VSCVVDRVSSTENRLDNQPQGLADLLDPPSAPHTDLSVLGVERTADGRAVA